MKCAMLIKYFEMKHHFLEKPIFLWENKVEVMK